MCSHKGDGFELEITVSPLINQVHIKNILWQGAACLRAHIYSLTSTHAVTLKQHSLTALDGENRPQSAVVLGRGGCGEIIPGPAEWCSHLTHREEWITPTGTDSDKLQGRRDSGPDKSPGTRAGLWEGDKTLEEAKA